MQDIAMVALIAGGILAALTMLKYWLDDKWSEFQRKADACACGLYSLTDIEAQHTSVAVHGREVCQPKREWIAR